MGSIGVPNGLIFKLRGGLGVSLDPLVASRGVPLRPQGLKIRPTFTKHSACAQKIECPGGYDECGEPNEPDEPSEPGHFFGGPLNIIP